jgi:hypothetical protein
VNDLRAQVQSRISSDSNAVDWAIAVERGKLADELSSNWNIVELIIVGSHVVGGRNGSHSILYTEHVQGSVTRRTAR